jgi:hypothetical protein
MVKRRFLLSCLLGLAIASCSHPLAVGATVFQFPAFAHVVSATDDSRVTEIVWSPASAKNFRCGERAEAAITFGPSLLPPSYSNCGRYDFFEGGSSEGECPVSHVCVAAIRQAQLVCVSDDESCVAVATAFAGTVGR